MGMNDGAFVFRMELCAHEQDSLTEKEITLENNKIKLHINTRGGRITYVELKEYRTHDSLPLVLWRPEKSTFGLNFYARNILFGCLLYPQGFHPGDGVAEAYFPFLFFCGLAQIGKAYHD